MRQGNSHLEREFDGVNLVAALDELEGFNGVFHLKMFKKFLNDGANVVIGVGDSGAFENVGECQCRRHFVQLDFVNAAADIIFERDNQRCVILPRNVQKFGIVAENLAALLGDNHDGRFVDKVNHVVDGLSVDAGGDEFARQNWRTKPLFLAVTVANSLVGIRQVNIDNGLNEFGW